MRPSYRARRLELRQPPGRCADATGRDSRSYSWCRPAHPGGSRIIRVVREPAGFPEKLDRDRVTRTDVLLLIKVGAFGFTGVPRAQLALAEQFYGSAAELLRAADRDPGGQGLTPVEGESPGAFALQTPEWPPEVLAAYELAHLGFYVLGRVSPVIFGGESKMLPKMLRGIGELGGNQSPRRPAHPSLSRVSSRLDLPTTATRGRRT
jgi:hypothetical protein